MFPMTPNEPNRFLGSKKDFWGVQSTKKVMGIPIGNVVTKKVGSHAPFFVQVSF